MNETLSDFLLNEKLSYLGLLDLHTIVHILEQESIIKLHYENGSAKIVIQLFYERNPNNQERRQVFGSELLGYDSTLSTRQVM